ncbi:MAG: hypothetical protein RBT50_10860 [Bacteroidales bacterium]|jgi:hypothetical protein|nr:hypothetical protein [Bacteroidales bacterium]
MNKKLINLLMHIPVLVIAILAAWFFSSDDVPAGKPNYVILSTIVSSFLFLASFYEFYSFLVPKYLEKGRHGAFWLYATLFALIIMPVVMLALVQITDVAALSMSEYMSGQVLLPWAGIALGTLFCGMLGLLYRKIVSRIIEGRM